MTSVSSCCSSLLCAQKSLSGEPWLSLEAATRKAVSNSIEISGKELSDSLSSWPRCTAAVLQQLQDEPSFRRVAWTLSCCRVGDISSVEPRGRRNWVPCLCLESPPSNVCQESDSLKVSTSSRMFPLLSSGGSLLPSQCVHLPQGHGFWSCLLPRWTVGCLRVEMALAQMRCSLVYVQMND